MKLGQLYIDWLNGGINHLDGGTMFGVVPKVLWSKVYPNDEKNRIPLQTNPILIRDGQSVLLIDSGLGNGKFSEKQIKNFGITYESYMEEDLNKLGLTTDDVTHVLMTHLHWDHASGLLHADGTPVFKNAKVYVSETEWNEMRKPNRRSQHTYWRHNWQGLEPYISTFKEQIEVTDAITMHHTGGHSDGHSIVVIETEDGKAYHMGDLMPTHAHRNPLWVLAFDDYPMTSIEQKEKWIEAAMQEEAWFIFYHDAIVKAIRWDKDGNVVEKIAYKE